MTHSITSVELKALDALLNYNWADEREHFIEHLWDEHGVEAEESEVEDLARKLDTTHIFKSLVILNHFYRDAIRDDARNANRSEEE